MVMKALPVGSAAFWDWTGQGRVWEGGEVPLKLSLRDHVSVFAICSMGGLLPEKKKERNEGKRQRYRKRERNHHHHHHHQYGRQSISRDMMRSTLNDILRNPPPRESQGRNAFLNPDFLSTFWHWLQGARPVGMNLKGQEQLPQGICRCPRAGWVPRLWEAGSLLTGLSKWRAQVSGQMPSSPCLTEGRVGVGRSWYEIAVHARAWRNGKVSSDLKGKKKPRGGRVAGGIRKGAFLWRGGGARKKSR